MKRSHAQILGAVAVLLAAALLVPADRAAAHADYESSTPAKGEVVPSAPTQVDVFFSQDVFKQAGANYVRVFGDDLSTQVSDGDGTVDDDNRRHISATLPAGLANGRYIVRWMTTSDDDGDTDDGAYCFYIGVQPTADQQAECAAFEPAEAPTSAATTTSEQPTPVPTDDDTPGADDDDGTSTGVIIGIVAGVVVAVVIVGGSGFWFMRRRS
jgi:methionine-rich copper-binding protein CopC